MKLTTQQRIHRAHNQLMRSPIFAGLSGVIAYGDVRIEDTLPTAATDGKNVIYNPEFVEKLDEKELTFIVVHENLHKAYRHLTTWAHLWKENAQLANMAADYCINWQIKNMDPKCEITRMPEDGLYDEKFANMDTQTIFNLLKQNPPEPQSGDGHGQPLDEHLWEQAQGMSEAEKQQVNEAIDSALRQGELLAGKLKGSSMRELGVLPDPEVDWREQLRDFVSSLANGRDMSTWRRPNRRHLYQNVYMPSAISETVGPIVIGVDTSGSISNDDVGAFLVEIASLCNQVTPESVDLLYWDTAVANEEHYEQGQYEMLIGSTKPAGGGGTSPQCVKKWIDKQMIKPEIVLMLSDGYVDDWPDFGVPTLWGMTSNIKAPNAVTIRIK